VLERPEVAERLSQTLAQRLKAEAVDVVLGPAIGGITFAYELARATGARAMFAEREGRPPVSGAHRQPGKMCLKRGFNLSSSDKVLIAEDVITTGGSVKEVIELVKAAGAKIIAVCSLADRSGAKVDFGFPYTSLLRLKIENFPPESCPLCKQGARLLKPGSR